MKLPTFSSHTGGFEVDILREKYVVMSGYDKIMDKVGTKNVTDDTINSSEQLSDRQKDIIKLLGYYDTDDVRINVRINASELAEKFSVTTRTIMRDMDVLVVKGLLRRVGARKNGYWDIVKK